MIEIANGEYYSPNLILREENCSQEDLICPEN